MPRQVFVVVAGLILVLVIIKATDLLADTQCPAHRFLDADPDGFLEWSEHSKVRDAVALFLSTFVLLAATVASIVPVAGIMLAAP
jgi:hypothetical protein